MKKLILFLISVFISIQVWAQTGNVILFTENGERFTAILNGVRQNNKPETNVKITGLNAEFYKLKVIFENNGLGEKNFNMGIELGSETTYAVKKNTKGEYVIRLVSAVPIADAPSSPTSQATVVYNQNPASSSTVTQQTTQTTTTSGNPDNVNVNVGINAGEQGGSVNMNISGMDATSTSYSTTTTTTTTTTTSSSEPVEEHHQHHSNIPPPSYLPGYNGPVGCPVPMSPGDFSSLKQTIAAKSFEETKMTIAKQVVAQQCLLVSQVKEIMQLFSFEDSKLEFAKYAYTRTYDVGNYFKVNDAFTFETSTDDLNKYIESKR